MARRISITRATRDLVLTPWSRLLRLLTGEGTTYALRVGNDALPFEVPWVESDAVPVPVNTVAPVISVVSNWGTLSCTTGTWLYSPTSYAYQWYRAGVAISGATSSSYSTVGNDGAGHTDYGPSITCRVTASNAGGAGTPVFSNALAYVPTAEAGTLLFSDPATLADGAVASFPCTGVGPTEVQGNAALRPVKSATSLNGTPGVTFDGVNDVLLYTSFDLSAQSAVVDIVGIKHNSPAGALAVINYHTPLNIISFRGFALTNGEVATEGRVGAYAHGVDYSGYGNSVSSAQILEIADGAVVLTVCYDTTVADGCSYMGIDGSTVSEVTVANSCTPGDLGNNPGYWGTSSDGVSYPWGGVRGVRVVYAGNTVGAPVRRIEQFIAWRTGKAPL